MRSLKSLVNLSLFLCLASLCTWGQSAVLSPLGGGMGPFFNADGSLASLGKVYTCVAGSSCPGTPLATYTDSTALTQNTNPVALNSGGFPQNSSGSIVGIWLTSGVAYKICLTNAAGVQQWCADNVAGLATTQNAANQSTVGIAFSATPTFQALAQNQLFSMTLTGNVTSSSLVMSGISTPSAVTFELTQDGTGNRTFVWPANFSGGCSINLAPNAVTTQSFLWDGTTAFALSDCRSNGVNSALPGEVRLYAGSNAPSGWFLCQGQAVSRLTYASLFSVIGTTFGTGDGSSTFNIPDLQGRVPIGQGQGSGLSNRVLAAKGGEENHTLTVAEMPAHSHTITASISWSDAVNPGFFSGTNPGAGSVGAQSGSSWFGINNNAGTITATAASTGGGSAHNNMQPFLVMNYICKY